MDEPSCEDTVLNGGDWRVGAVLALPFMRSLTSEKGGQGGWDISRLARISLSIHITTLQEIRPIVKINAAVFLCDAIVGIGL